jgi:hypothetical protein
VIRLREAARLCRIRDQLHQTGAPNWMGDVVATAVGPKVRGGVVTDQLAIQVVVPQKVPGLSAERSVAPFVGGIPTDVIDGSEPVGVATGPEAPAAEVAVGLPIVIPTSAEQGTIGCAAWRGGAAVLLTAAHVVREGQEALLLQDRTPVGRCELARDSATRAELYGRRAVPEGPFVVDLAVLHVPRGRIFRGGAGQPQAVIMRPSNELLPDLVNTEALSFSGSSGAWRRGFVTGLWPKRASDGAVGLCLIKHEPLSVGGDSGSLWIVRKDGQLFAIGLHWGLVRAGGSLLAFVSDLPAICALLGVKAIAGRPDEIVTGS